jgi:hypothetical protein
MILLVDFSIEKFFPQYGQEILLLFPKFKKISGCFELKEPPSHENLMLFIEVFSEFLKFV